MIEVQWSRCERQNFPKQIISSVFMSFDAFGPIIIACGYHIHSPLSMHRIPWPRSRQTKPAGLHILLYVIGIDCIGIPSACAFCKKLYLTLQPGNCVACLVIICVLQVQSTECVHLHDIAAPQLPMQRLRGLRMLPAADALINGVPARAHRKAAKFQIWGQTCAAQGHHTCSETSHHAE